MVSQVSQQQMAGHAQSQVNIARNQILNGSSFGQILRKGILGGIWFGWVFVQDLPVCWIDMELFLTLYLVFRYLFTLDPPARRKTDGFVSKCVGLAINHPQCNKVNPPQQSRDAGFPLIKLSTGVKNLIFGLRCVLKILYKC